MKDKRKYLKFSKRALLYCSCALVLCGCVNNNEPMPEIVYSPGLGRELAPPKMADLEPIDENSYTNIPRAWLPPSNVEKKWTAIIIHHSATEKGNAEIFDRWHKENNHWEGVGYDFVIGNGTDSGDGQVEVTFRWKKQITGAHCGGTSGNWANEDGIGICLVGDFSRTTPSERQMQSLVKLIRFLQQQYGIPKSRIYGHRTTPGARVTECPGDQFPMSRLKSMLSY